MFGIFLSALNVVLGFVFRSVLVKFVLYFGLFFVVTEFIQVISYLLPDSSSFSSSLAGIPSGVWYFLDLFNVSLGIPILLSSLATRFIICRIPLIG